MECRIYLGLRFQPGQDSVFHGASDLQHRLLRLERTVSKIQFRNTLRESVRSSVRHSQHRYLRYAEEAGENVLARIFYVFRTVILDPQENAPQARKLEPQLNQWLNYSHSFVKILTYARQP